MNNSDIKCAWSFRICIVILIILLNREGFKNIHVGISLLGQFIFCLGERSLCAKHY